MGGNGSDNGDDKSEKNQPTGIKLEKWWQTTIQVSIPFFIAGIGTIGAGIILGHVEVSSGTLRKQLKPIAKLREIIQLSHEWKPRSFRLSIQVFPLIESFDFFARLKVIAEKSRGFINQSDGKKFFFFVEVAKANTFSSLDFSLPSPIKKISFHVNEP